MALFLISPILFPLLGMLINATLGKRLGEKAVGAIATLAVLASFVMSFMMFTQLLGMPASTGESPEHGGAGLHATLFPWITAGTFNVSWGIRVDQLSGIMMLIITGIGALIHIYSIGYMHGDERFPRFFVYLNLFVSSMLVLVMSDNFLGMFVGWELVGLCSYLLIGFWFKNVKNAEAGRKAFVVNRIGDVGFVLGILLIFVTFGSLNYTEVFKAVEENAATAAGAAGLITLLLFVGAMGKSAQIPLLVWLPDAMAGPTPVSALIHAATMVTAGIYMMTRSHALYLLAPNTQAIVAIIGALTAIVAGYAALTQFDIKKVLAYSTVSQLGFMVAAAGMGAYVAGMFHLLTHAFFKALLFLAAGSVIHGMEHWAHSHPKHGHHHTDPQDMRNMGGLSKKMPITFITFLLGGLALAGVPPLSGFFSKDEIVLDALAHNLPVFVLLTVAAFFTAFYTGRQLIMVFFGAARTQDAEHAVESNGLMTLPLVVLAVGAVVAGALNLPGSLWLKNWLEPVLGKEESPEFSIVVAGIFTVLALFGLGLAWVMYRHAYSKADSAEPLAKLGPLYALSSNKWYLDEIYNALIIKPFYIISTVCAQVLDVGLIDAVVNGVGNVTRNASTSLRGLQTGFVRNYGLFMLVGVVVVVAYFVVNAR